MFGRATEPWHSFEDILNRLHGEGIYLNAEQLATFFTYHGLPVNLRYVPEALRERAHLINIHYQGDLARIDNRPIEAEFMYG